MIRIKQILIITVSICSSALAQHFDGVSLGLAGNYTAMSRGVDAMVWNPANLALPRGNSFELNIAALNLSISNNAFSLNEYNRYFTKEGNNGYWSYSDREEMLNLIPDDGLRINSDGGANALGLTWNNFGLSLQMIEQSTVHLSDKYPLEMILLGETISRDYQYNNSSFIGGESYSAAKISFGYAFPLDTKSMIHVMQKLSLGLNLNYYLGLTAARIVRSDIHVQRIPGEDDDAIKYRAEFEIQQSIPENPSPAGGGFGLDFGATGYVGKRWQVSLVVTNLFAKIRWTENVQTMKMLEADSINVLDLSGDNEINTSVSEDTTYASEPFSTPLPTQIRLGALYRFSKDLTLTAEYQQGVDEYFGNSTTPRIGVGVQYYPLYWLPLRFGVALGGKDTSMLGMGFGLHFGHFEFDISYAMSSAMWPTSSEGLFLATGFKFQF